MSTEAPGAPRRSRTGRTVVIGVLLVLGLLAAVIATQLGGGDSSGLAQAPGGLAVPALADRPAPNEQFALPDVTLDGFGGGEPVQTSSYRGTPLVLNFWAAWCAPCVREMPDFQKVAVELDGEVAVLGVDVMDAASNAEPFVQRLGISYDLAVDLRGEYWTQVRSFGMPTTLFVRPDGTVVYRHTGPMDAARLRELVDQHLGVAVR